MADPARSTGGATSSGGAFYKPKDLGLTFKSIGPSDSAVAPEFASALQTFAQAAPSILQSTAGLVNGSQTAQPQGSNTWLLPALAIGGVVLIVIALRRRR